MSFLINKHAIPLTHLPPEQDGRPFADYIIKYIFENEKYCI